MQLWHTFTRITYSLDLETNTQILRIDQKIKVISLKETNSIKIIYLKAYQVLSADAIKYKQPDEKLYFIKYVAMNNIL